MGIRLALNTNIDQVFQEMDAYVDAIKAVAIPRSLNELSDNANVVILREMAKQYGLQQNVLRQYMRQVRATVPGGVQASVEVFGRGLPLILFSPTPSAPTRGKPRGKGVTVRIKGKRIFIPHAFIQRMPNGHVGVFVRGAYGGKSSKRGLSLTGESLGRFQLSSSRLPINELYTTSPPTMAGNRNVVEAANARVETQAPVVIARNIRFAASRL